MRLLVPKLTDKEIYSNPYYLEIVKNYLLLSYTNNKN